MNFNDKRYAEIGERVTLEMPHSEVCMHMQVAGKVMHAEIQPRGYSAQLFRLDGQMFSAPITTGEAGFYRDGDRFYYYAAEVPQVCQYCGERPCLSTCIRNGRE